MHSSRGELTKFAPDTTIRVPPNAGPFPGDRWSTLGALTNEKNLPDGAKSRPLVLNSTGSLAATACGGVRQPTSVEEITLAGTIPACPNLHSVVEFGVKKFDNESVTNVPPSKRPACGASFKIRVASEYVKSSTDPPQS